MTASVGDGKVVSDGERVRAEDGPARPANAGTGKLCELRVLTVEANTRPDPGRAPAASGPMSNTARPDSSRKACQGGNVMSDGDNWR